MVRVILAAILILATGCQAGESNPSLTPGLSGEAEALIGQRAAPALERRFGGTVSDSIALDRLRRIGRRLAAATPELAVEWQFQILASDTVNAFSLPGGLIYITRGLYRRVAMDEVFLAAIVAHEMAHVVHKDSLKPSCCCEQEARWNGRCQPIVVQRATLPRRATTFKA